MPNPKRFSFSAAAGATREASSLPFLPLSLQIGDGAPLHVEGLLDTGATVSVLPYSVGLRLGAVWSEEAQAVRLTGNLDQFEARALLVSTQAKSWGQRIPKVYEDQLFQCEKCGKEEKWTAKQQQWWFEVAKGPIESRAVMCRECRMAEKARTLRLWRVGADSRRRRSVTLAPDGGSH